MGHEDPNWTEFHKQQKAWLENSRPGFTGPALLLLHLFSSAVLTVILSMTASLPSLPHRAWNSLYIKLQYEKSPSFACDPELVKVLAQPVCLASSCSILATLRLCSQASTSIMISPWKSTETSKRWWINYQRQWWMIWALMSWSVRSAIVLTICLVGDPKCSSAAIVCAPNAW